jgi:hypothetical protein
MNKEIVSKMSDAEITANIKGAKYAISRNEGMIKKHSEKLLELALAEQELRAEKVGSDIKKDVKKDVKAVEKEAKKVEKKVVAAVKKPTAKKVASKKTVTPKKVSSPKVKATPKPSSTEKFELTIDGEVFKFSDLASKEACKRANDAVKARYKEVTEHKAATKEGIERASTTPVTQRISDGFASIAKKAVSEVPVTKINKKPEDVKKEIQAVETAFNNLFDKLGDLMGKQIPNSQRKEIMAILTKFEEKVEKGSSKKDVATSKVRKKEDGGMAGSGVDMFGAGNSWSYASLM